MGVTGEMMLLREGNCTGDAGDGGGVSVRGGWLKGGFWAKATTQASNAAGKPHRQRRMAMALAASNPSPTLPRTAWEGDDPFFSIGRLWARHDKKIESSEEAGLSAQAG